VKTVFLDLETTGLDPRTDEIVEIGVLDEDGQVLLDTLVRPVRHQSWPEAQRVHGIPPAAVQDAPTLDDLRPRIIEAVSDAQVVIYNAPFDASFLRPELGISAGVRCAMREFAEAFGEWSDWHGNWRWQKLLVAADYVGFDWGGASHRAINDAQATRAVWRYLIDPEERHRVDALHREAEQAEEAASALRSLELDLQHAWKRFRLRKSRFWMRWLRLSEPHILAPAERDAITRAFTGCICAVWDEWQIRPRLPVYWSHKAIPAELVPASRVQKAVGSWVLDEIEPLAVYVADSGTRLSWLYSIEQAKQRQDARLPRFERRGDVPEGWVTKTTAKRDHGIDALKQGLEPVGEIRQRMKPGRVYAPLFALSSDG
jgi:DNA polymerase-3 subunit epsilon